MNEFYIVFLGVQTAESLRIKGLAENPLSFEEFPSQQPTANSSVTPRLGSQVCLMLTFVLHHANLLMVIFIIYIDKSWKSLISTQLMLLYL